MVEPKNSYKFKLELCTKQKLKIKYKKGKRMDKHIMSQNKKNAGQVATTFALAPVFALATALA